MTTTTIVDTGTRMTTTTISDIFTPPVPPPHVPRCEPSMIRCAQGVQRHLPPTGNGWLFAGIAFAACVTGYALLRLSNHSTTTKETLP